jgi:hypothetical protein
MDEGVCGGCTGGLTSPGLRGADKWPGQAAFYAAPGIAIHRDPGYAGFGDQKTMSDLVH